MDIERRTKMKSMSLTTWERIQLLKCVPPSAPTIEMVRKHLRVAGVLGLTEKEKELIGWQERNVPTPQGTQTQSIWQDTEREWEIDFEDADFEHLRQLVNQRQSWPTVPETLILDGKLREVK